MAKTAKVKANASDRACVVVQTGSSIRCDKSQVIALKALGLGKIGKKVTLKDDGCIRGLIRKVSHLVKVEGLNG